MRIPPSSPVRSDATAPSALGMGGTCKRSAGQVTATWKLRVMREAQQGSGPHYAGRAALHLCGLGFAVVLSHVAPPDEEDTGHFTYSKALCSVLVMCYVHLHVSSRHCRLSDTHWPCRTCTAPIIRQLANARRQRRNNTRAQAEQVGTRTFPKVMRPAYCGCTLLSSCSIVWQCAHLHVAPICLFATTLPCTDSSGSCRQHQQAVC